MKQPKEYRAILVPAKLHKKIKTSATKMGVTIISYLEGVFSRMEERNGNKK